MHLEVLTPKARELYPLLRNFDGFYLAGGTALALQIGHRVSVDFDLFSASPIKKTLLKKVEEIFSHNQIKILVNNSSELSLLVDEVKITFLHYPFPLLKPLKNELGLSLTNIEEIGAMKAYTIGRRGSWKDYVDLYFLLKGGYSNLNSIISLAKEKYSEVFNDRLFLEQLIYLDDIEEEDIIFIGHSITKNIALETFKTATSKIKLL